VAWIRRRFVYVDEFEFTARFTFRFISDTPGSNIHLDLFQDGHLGLGECVTAHLHQKQHRSRT
jgi:hypothetical protein